MKESTTTAQKRDGYNLPVNSLGARTHVSEIVICMGFATYS